MAKYYTHDGVEVTEGLDVFTSEWLWGKVTKVASWPENEVEDAWHEVTYPNGRRVHLNQERITTRKPQ